ncbi:MAG: MMPL family transporter [Acidobacteriota bacterium]|nr:MMPL family transporter [Acidobacteriota bacterium]
MPNRPQPQERLVHRPAFRISGAFRGARARAVLAAWAVTVLALALLGQGIEGRLSPMSLTVPGSPSSRAEAMLQARFGNTVPMAVLLRGPSAELSQQGQALVGALRRLPDVQVLSPFDARASMAPATVKALRPGPDSALVLVNFVRAESAAMATVPETEAILARVVRGRVHSYLSGVAVIGHALQSATLADTARAEMFALPALIIVLLLVFRSPVAAALPLLMGAATVTAGRGMLWLASFVTPINSLGVAVAAMMSLALGVDYALLMVSRMRQELAAGHPQELAIRVAGRAAGRTIAAAGGTLALTMLAASAVATPGLLGPVAIGVVISGLLSVALAMSAMPALLHLLGDRVNRWEIKVPGRGRAGRRTGLAGLAARLIARPALTVPVILGAMMVLAVPAGALRMGPPDATELPASSPARTAVRMLERTIGPGWSAPFVIVASARHGAMTTTARIDALAKWQEMVSREADVAAVLGPASVAGAQRRLGEAHAALTGAPRRLKRARRGVDSLRSGLRAAGSGIEALRAGLAQAAGGAHSLGEGARHAHAGAAYLASASGRAHTGAAELAAQTARAHSGAQRLAAESGRAATGAGLIASESERAAAGAGRLQQGLAQAADGSAALASGLDEASAGADHLAKSDRVLAKGAGEVAQGLDTLDATVHAVLAPIKLLSEALRGWSEWIEQLRADEQRSSAHVSEAMRALESIGVAHEDPRYRAVQQALAALAQAREQGGMDGLVAIGQRLGHELESLAGLPRELTEMVTGLDRLTAGANRVAAGADESASGAEALNVALRRLAAGGHSLKGGIVRSGEGAGSLANGLGRLSAGNGTLANGLGRLSAGNGTLANGLGRLSAGNRTLAGGLGQLASGDRGLAGGLGQLRAGAGRLSGALTSAHASSAKLTDGLAGAQGGLHHYATMLANYERSYKLLHTDAPNTLSSGYLVLTALDGTVSPVREQVAQLVNVDGGGQAVRLMVVADSAPSSAATVALSQRLRRDLPALAAATGASVQIGQGAQYLLDYKNANTARFPWLVLALGIVATLTLVVVLRALLLPLVAVLLNLATIGVALGILEWLTQQRLLGGPGYIDAASGAGIVSIMFVLSIDYEVFLLTRMREARLSGMDHRAAIAHGLRHTAGVITGSAVIMTAVFAAFAGATVVPLSQFGVGLTVAVLLDATVVRLVLLPAIMRAAGERLWWLPDWLERRLPYLEGRADAHGAGSRAELEASARGVRPAAAT